MSKLKQQQQHQKRGIKLCIIVSVALYKRLYISKTNELIRIETFEKRERERKQEAR